MKPILFDGSATTYSGNGLGRLNDCVSCEVTEQRNGIFEVEFEYPLSGVHYDLITEGRIILVSHDEQKDLQPFEIYRISKAISGIVVVNARHISYKLNHVIVSPYTATNITTALAGLTSHAITPNGFTFWTDKTSTGNFAVEVPTSVRALLGGKQGSILDAFGGGEYEFDGYTVKLYAHRGADNGVTIRYGKNLTDIDHESDSSDLYNAVVPYWAGSSGQVVYGNIVTGNGGIIHEETWTDESNIPIQDENGTELTFRAALRQVVPMDLSDEFEEKPTVAQLQSRAQTILNNNEPWVPKVSIDVDFVALWQTEEYKNIAPLERVRLCDTVHVQYPALGVDATAKVIKVVWDAVAERYTKIELGDAKTSFADVLMAETQSMMQDYPSTSMMQDAIDYATAQITGGMGGNIVLTRDGNGDPIELLIMDTKDKTTAVNVWRWNLGGLGHSHSGYDGPFDDFAITQDGKINASMITVGTLNANVIAANSISVSKLTGSISNGNWKLDLDAGTFTIGNMSADNITTGTLNVARIAANSVPVGKLSGSITNNNWEINLTAGTLTIGNISATNIVSGTLTLGGSGAKANGKLEIYNSSDTLLGSFSKSGITINSGTLTTTNGNQKTTIGSGVSNYYYSNTLVGTIGANSANSEDGIIFDLKTAGDYMGWFLNGVNNPILIYDKSDWLSKDIWSDCLNVVCDLHISNGATLAGSRIANPSWQFSGTNYAGYTGTVTVGSKTMTFKNGVLVNA